MKPKVTFTATGNSYDLNLPTGATNISNSPPKYTTTQTNYVSGASGARLTSGGIYNTNQGLTINNNINRPLTTNITTTSQANIVSQPSYMTTGYAAPPSGRYTSTIANQGGQITTKYVQPSVQTYATQQVNVPVQQYQVQQVQQVQQVPIQTVQTQAINLQPVVASTPTLPPATTPIAVSQVQRFDNIKTSQVNRVQSQQVIEEYERPHYNKIYNNPRLEERKQAPLTEEPTRTGSCCGLPCWILLGLLGLAGLILGLLFGLGVLGRSGASKDMGAASNTNGTSTNGTGINGTAIINGTGTNGSGVINGSGTTNGGIVINGTGGNGAVSINGNGTTNGTVSINGTGTINATGTTNGTASINGTGTTNGSSFINGTSTNGSAVINGSAAINGSSSLINGSSFQVPQGQIIEEQQVFVPPTIIEPQIYQFNYTQPQEVPAVQVKPTITSPTAQTGSNQTLSSTLGLKDSSAITRPESSDGVRIASNQTNLRHQGSVQHELTPVSNLDVY